MACAGVSAMAPAGTRTTSGPPPSPPLWTPCDSLRDAAGRARPRSRYGYDRARHHLDGHPTPALAGSLL